MKSLFFFLTLWTFLPLFAGYAPDNVQTALTKMYPSAKGIAWSQDEEYYVADFMMNGFDTKVWFNTDAEWVMKQTDWETLDEVPAAVFNAFAASQFSDGVVQNVVWVQFPKWQPIVAIQVGRLNVQIKYQILFTPNGEVLRQQNITYAYNTLGASTCPVIRREMPGCRVGISLLSLGIKNKAVYFLYSLFTLSLPQRKTLSYESDYFSARCLQCCCRYS